MKKTIKVTQQLDGARLDVAASTIRHMGTRANSNRPSPRVHTVSHISNGSSAIANMLRLRIHSDRVSNMAASRKKYGHSVCTLKFRNTIEGERR